MKGNIDQRCVTLGTYIAENKATVRSCAKQFSVSKSTVHKDITERLEKINHQLYEDVKCVLDQNKKERHLRGGRATKEKYEKLKHQG